MLLRRLAQIVLLALLSSILPLAGAKADRNLAFVVGNSKYDHAGSLDNARRDAAAMADRLRELGFDVTEVFDGDAFTLNRAADRFIGQAKGSDLALFYFAGHGIQLFDRNFLLARDADPAKIARVEDLGLDLTHFMTRLRNSGTVRQALLIDACRNNPFAFEETVRLLDLVRKAGAAKPGAATDTTGSRGLARVVLVEPGRQISGAETLFFFAAQPGQVSFDGAGQNSYFMEGFKEELSKTGRPLSEVFRNVSAYVRTVTKGEQVPQVVSDWTGDIVLGQSAAERVKYNVIASVDRKTLSKADHDLVVRSAAGFGKFHGDFIAKAGIGNLPHHDMSDADKAKAEKLGNAQGFTIKYDLDRDGREENVHVFFQQTGFWLSFESQGVIAQLASCIDGDTPTAIEVALKDINGDRRPEVWVAYETEETSGWGKFCILEFQGIPNLAERRRASTGQINLGFTAFRTLLRGDAGWGVTVANDNTIKACGGSNCHTSWTYTYDGNFRLIESSDEKPTGGAALPFADEKQHAANIYAGLSRSSGSVVTQNWRTARANTGVVSATARVGRRTEVAYECNSAGNGTLSYEALVFRDKPPQNASGGVEIEIEPTLAYGESAAQAPMLLDGRPCGSVTVSAGEGGAVNVTPPDDAPSACFANLARAKVATLPLLQGKDLLRIRLDGAAEPLASARSACSGRVAGLPQRQQQPIAPQTSSPPQTQQQAGSLDDRARQFLEDYMRRTEGETEQVLSFVRNNFEAVIRYYGKVVRNAQVVDEKRRYLSRWPQRRYTLKPETTRIQCDEARATCQMSGELSYDVRDPRASRASSGSATYELRVVFSQAGPKIVEENGQTVARQN